MASGTRHRFGGKKKKHKKKGDADKQGKNTGTTAASGGGNPWSILSYLPKIFSGGKGHSGGKVAQTGTYRLRKGELVLTKAQQKKVGIKQRGKNKVAHKRVSGKA